MPVPLIVWGVLGVGGAGALTLGGRAAGEEIGESVGRAVPWLMAGTALYLVMRAQK